MTPKPVRQPGYWMNETSGELVPAIVRYLEGDALSVRDVALIRVYIEQWIGSGVWDTNPAQTEESRAELAVLRELARVLTNREAIDAWISMAVDFGMDPL